MAQTEKNGRKLLSCSYTFCVLKLIIFVLVLFISIKGDDGDNAYSQNGNGAGVDDDNQVNGGWQTIKDGIGSRKVSDGNGKQTHYDFNANESEDLGREKILSRRRRYLIFPEGSSLQVVGDTVIPVVDYANLLTLGITAAMAWELPSEPVDIEQMLRDSYEEGNLPLLHRSDNITLKADFRNTSRTTTKPSSVPLSIFKNNQPPNKYYYSTNPYTNSGPHPYYTKYENDKSPSLDRYYYSNSHLPQRPGVPQPNSNKLKYYLSYADKFLKEFSETAKQNQQGGPSVGGATSNRSDVKSSGKNGKKSAKKKKGKLNAYVNPKRHFIHPAFKRSAENNPYIHPIEKVDLMHHRKTRHVLYQQIEKFLHAQGNHGMDCILKTLCETGQRRNDDEPGSMVIELLRAIFTLPNVSSPVQSTIHRQYDSAHTSDQNCSEMYPKCRGSIWESQFNN